jgi:hypothetical protein
MDTREGSDGRVIGNGHMASQRSRIGQDDMVAYDTVMSDMGIGHNQSVIANDRATSPGRSSAMNGDVLTEDIGVAHDKLGQFPFVF